MTDKFCLAINGLDEQIFGNPLAHLAAFLNGRTPVGVHFAVVGGADPRPFQHDLEQQIDRAVHRGNTILIVGHSLGAMMCFYLQDFAKRIGGKIKLLVPIDATQWGTNMPGVPPWLLGGANAGKYQVQDNVENCLYFRQPLYPGGGFANLAPGNATTKLLKQNRVEAHVILPVLPDIQQAILSAIQEAIK